MRIKNIFKKTGFTLLEIVIVVVIIGILASIALPSYNRIVERSRLSEAVNMLSILRDAQLRYALEKDSASVSYASSLSDLDINVSANGKFFTFYAVPNLFGVIASASRNRISVGGGYDKQYSVYIYENGTFVCAGNPSCPSEFLP